MMITKFAVTNYRGFSKRIELDLSNPSNYSFHTEAVKNGIVKNGILYGPNGSGKSNLALAIFDIVNHLSQKWKKTDYYNNFVFAGSPQTDVVFEYFFRFDTQTVEYMYGKNSQGSLTSERLSVDGKPIFSNEKGKLFIDPVSYPMDEEVLKSLGNSANNVSIVNFLITSYPLPEGHYLLKLRQFVGNMLWFKSLDTREFIGLVNHVTNLDEYIIKNNLLEDFHNFVFKVSDQRFDFATPQANDRILFCNYGDAKVPFDQIASTGTQALMLLYYWIHQMGNASFVFIDEFDAFYHFKLSFEVCKRLFSLGCQVFVSSHNTYLMTNDLLRPDCNFILADNKVKPLCECTDKELRFGHNIEKMFRGGTFAV